MPQAYCSWCYHETHHTQEEKNYLRRNRYRCTRCSNTTYECRACSHMARGGKSWDDEFCSEHSCEIPLFSQLKHTLASIDKADHLFPDNRATLADVTAEALSDRKITRLLSGGLKEFRITLNKSGENRRALIFINGFLSQDNLSDQDWSEQLATTEYQDDTWYRVHREFCRIQDVLASATEMTRDMVKISPPGSNRSAPLAYWAES